MFIGRRLTRPPSADASAIHRSRRWRANRQPDRVRGRTCRRRAAALQSSFLAAMCRAGSRTFPRVSFSRRTATTLSCPCCKATASGVNPSCSEPKKKTVVVKQSYGRLPALLSHLRRQTLVGSVGQQEADHGVVILLGRHVQRRESVLRLDVDGSAILHQDLDHLFLAGCGRQAKR